MLNCSSCGYATPRERLVESPTGKYCPVCVAIGGARIDANPDRFGDSKYFVPPIGFVTNMILDAIATRQEATDLPAAEPAGMKAYIVISRSPDGDSIIEFQDPEGKPIEIAQTRFQPVEGTDFQKFAVVLPLK